MKSYKSIAALRARGTLMILFLVLSSCTRDLTKQDAAKQIDEHFHAVAPNVLKALKIDITEILSPDENNRDVRFTEQHELVPWGTQEQEIKDDKKAVKKISRTTYSVYFQKSSRGWTLRRYGHGTGNLVNTFRVERFAMVYQPLVQTLFEVGFAVPSSMHDSNQLSENTIAAIIAEKKVAIPSGVTWGFRRPNSRLQKGVLWVRDSKDEKVMCARTVGSFDQVYLPSDFLWLSDKNSFQPTCTGKSHSGNIGDMMDEGEQVVARNDGVFPPYKAE